MCIQTQHLFSWQMIFFTIAILIITFSPSMVSADDRLPNQHAPIITFRGTAPDKPKASGFSESKASGYFLDPYKTKCRSLGAFRDGLKRNPPDGPQNLRYQSNADRTITFRWSCADDFKIEPVGRKIWLRTSGFQLFCCDCSNERGQQHRIAKVVDEMGDPVSQVTLPVKPNHDYGWSVSCNNTRREPNEPVPKSIEAHPNVARLERPQTVLRYQYYSGNYAKSIDDEFRERKIQNEAEYAENREAFEEGFDSAKDKKKFVKQWNAKMRQKKVRE